MIENEIDNDIENEIENDFNNDNLSNVVISNENEVDNIFNEEIYTNSTRDNNKIMNISGYSLLRELEDKWDSIERKKNNTFGNKNFQNNIIEQEKKKNNYLKLEKEIKKLKNNFIDKIQKQKVLYENKEFAQFIFDKISEMEKYKIKSEEIIKQLQQREIEKLNENKPKNSNKQIENSKKENIKKRDQLSKNKSFLQQETNNYDKRKIPLKYRGNLFTCKEITDVEGLVYETPDNINDNNKIKIYNPISNNLKNKMKNVYDDILKPTYLPDNIFNNVIMESSRENNITEENQDLKNNKFNIENNNKNNQFNIENNNINNQNNNIINKNINNNQNNSLVNYSINSNFAFETNINSKTLYSLEKNFDEILITINPNMKQINKGNSYMGSIKNDNYSSNEKKNSLINEENNPELDKYFEDLSIQAGFKIPNSISKKINKRKDFSPDDTYYIKNNMKDKKFLKKMEENVQLLNQLVKISSAPNTFEDKIKSINNSNNNSSYNIINNSQLNKSYIRSHNMSINSSQNINNSNFSFMNNRVYSKNRFEDILSRMYKSNALKIQKIIQNK